MFTLPKTPTVINLTADNFVLRRSTYSCII